MHNNFEREKIEGLKWEAIKQYKKDTANNNADIENSEVTFENGNEFVFVRDKYMNIIAHYVERKNGQFSRIDNEK